MIVLFRAIESKPSMNVEDKNIDNLHIETKIHLPDRDSQNISVYFNGRQSQ